MDKVTEAEERAAQIQEAAVGWSLRLAVEALLALRGVGFLTTATVRAEEVVADSIELEVVGSRC